MNSVNSRTSVAKPHVSCARSKTATRAGCPLAGKSDTVSLAMDVGLREMAYDSRSRNTNTVS